MSGEAIVMPTTLTAEEMKWIPGARRGVLSHEREITHDELRILAIAAYLWWLEHSR